MSRLGMLAKLLLSLAGFGMAVPGALAQDNSIGLQPESTPTLEAASTPLPSAVAAPADEAAPDLLENLGQDRPWLGDLYQWNESYNLDKEGVAAQKAGAY